MLRLIKRDPLRLRVQFGLRELRPQHHATAKSRVRPAMLRVYRLRRNVVDSNVMHRLWELRLRQNPCDGHVARPSSCRSAQDVQLVVAASGCPPSWARVEINGGGGVGHGVKGAGVPAGPWANALGNLVGEEEVEVGLTQRRLGDPFDLLQHPRPQIGIRGGASRDRLPGPREPDARQMGIDAHQMQCR